MCYITLGMYRHDIVYCYVLKNKKGVKFFFVLYVPMLSVIFFGFKTL